jgi:uncharacterized glyoxalase superfamily protein PhnB
MPSIESYRKQARLLVRWHRERNYSIGEKVRLLERYRHLTDIEILEMAMPLTLAQEIVAVENGFRDWTALKSGTGVKQISRVDTGGPTLLRAVPILFVRDVAVAATFYEVKLGFSIDFLHGKPPFYGSVSRDRAWLHLRLVHQTNFGELAAREDSLILATIEVANVKALFHEYTTRSVDFAQRLVRQAWGGLDFQVRDPDGNVISFAQYGGFAAQGLSSPYSEGAIIVSRRPAKGCLGRACPAQPALPAPRRDPWTAFQSPAYSPDSSSPHAQSDSPAERHASRRRAHQSCESPMQP